MKNSIKKISILIISIIGIMLLTSAVLAVDVNTSIDLVETYADDTDVTGKPVKVAGTILKYAQWIAIIGSVIVITILGVKYMMGSLEEKAAYKKSMIPLVVGCVIAIGATSIANFLFGIFQS